MARLSKRIGSLGLMRRLYDFLEWRGSEELASTNCLVRQCQSFCMSSYGCGHCGGIHSSQLAETRCPELHRAWRLGIGPATATSLSPTESHSGAISMQMQCSFVHRTSSDCACAGVRSAMLAINFGRRLDKDRTLRADSQGVVSNVLRSVLSFFDPFG